MCSFIKASIVLLFSLLSEITAESQCTNGRLFVADANSSSVYYFDLDGELEGLASTGSLLDGMVDIAGQTVIFAGDNEIGVIHRGSEASMYGDGSVRFYRVGTILESHGDHMHVEKVAPIELQNAKINCARATHYVDHDDKITFFCDGYFNPDPSGTQVNTTVHVVDKTRFAFAAEPSAIAHSIELQGSHHGVAVAVDENHLLVSVPTPERIARVENSSSLPNGFVVQDYEGELLHDLNVADDKDRSCVGYHGTAASEGMLAMGCDTTHGGILLVDYESSTAAYTSRSLVYPENFTDHRVGSFVEHPLASHVIANFNSDDSFNLFAFDAATDAITEDHLLALPAKACSSAYELAEANIIFTFLETGVVKVYQFRDKWELLSQVEVIPGMTDCATAFMTPGYGQAFVFERAAMKMYAIDATELMHSLHNETTVSTMTDSTTGLTVATSTLPFMPNSASASGVPKGYACVAEDNHDHENENENPSPVMAPTASVTTPTASSAKGVGGMYVLALSALASMI